MAKKTRANKKQDVEVEESRVTSLELFFDLVFVFTLTQLTALLSKSLSWERLLQSFLIFIVLFWMYGGYVWLTNSVPPVTADRQLLLIAGMSAFLICALAIPNAFQAADLAFGIGYLIVIIVLLLVALGESIVAIGAGALELTLRFILAAVLGLILTAALWWIYFARDEEVARDTMLARPNPEQLRQALSAFFYAFIPMLFGIILLATGIKSSIEHLTTGLDIAHAFAFGGGVSLYLMGTTIFRRASGISEVTYRYIAAGLAVLTGFVGSNFYAALQFTGLILILIVLVLVESNWTFARQSG